MIYNFYDTCSLLLKANHMFDEEENLVISSITLQELENIKTSANKDAEVKCAARKVMHLLNENYSHFNIIMYEDNFLNNLNSNFEITNDLKIISCAKEFSRTHSEDEIIFFTNDLCCKHIALMYLPEVKEVNEDDYDYDGYKEISMSSEDLTFFYSNLNQNIYNLYTNEYLIIRDAESEEIVDKVRWDGKMHKHLTYETFTSNYFGNVKPMKGDAYQALVADSFLNNKITMVKGPAGTGKTFLSLGYLLYKLDHHQIDKIIIFCNTVATKNSAKLGYYPGTRDEKLLDSQIGNLLISKIGGRIEVERMIEEEKIVLLPLSDIRGYDTSGMRAGIYISEAQNLDISLMKLTLQRIGEDSICIIDGDCKTQVDDISFAGSNNGMKRASKVFRGNDIYGEVTLKNIHRSRIAKIAENM